MATFTIDIPDEKLNEVVAFLLANGVVIREPKQDIVEDETSYLLKSPNNASRLLQAIKDYESGKGTERLLDEE